MLLIALCGSAGTAAAQVVSPMIHDVQTVSQIAAARFEVANPYEHAQTSEFFIVDDAGRAVRGAQVSPARKRMAGGARAPLLVRVPVGPNAKRRVYVCHAITPRHPNSVASGTSYRGEVCATLDITRPEH